MTGIVYCDNILEPYKFSNEKIPNHIICHLIRSTVTIMSDTSLIDGQFSPTKTELERMAIGLVETYPSLQSSKVKHRTILRKLKKRLLNVQANKRKRAEIISEYPQSPAY